MIYLRDLITHKAVRDLTDVPTASFGKAVRQWRHGPMCDRALILQAVGRMEVEGYPHHASIRFRISRTGNPAATPHQIDSLWATLNLEAWLQEPAPERAAC